MEKLNIKVEVEDQMVENSEISSISVSTFQYNHLQTLLAYLEDDSTKNVVFLSNDGQVVRAHSLILAACSDYFREMLLHQFDKDSEHVINVPDHNCDDLHSLFEYLYSGQLNFNCEEDSDALIGLIGEFKIKGSYFLGRGSRDGEIEPLKTFCVEEDVNSSALTTNILDDDALDDDASGGKFSEDDRFASDLDEVVDDDEDDLDFDVKSKSKGKRGVKRKKAESTTQDGVSAKKRGRKCTEKSDKSTYPKRQYIKRDKNDPENKRTTCNICGQNYNNARALKAHEKSSHSKWDKNTIYVRGKRIAISELETVLPFQCTVCLKRFENELGLKKHLEFICKICNRCLGWKASYDKHMVTHGEAMVHKCIQCEQSFGDYQLLLAHEKDDHGNVFSCVPCKKNFDNRRKLREHQKRKHECYYTCDLCTKIFTSPLRLKQHTDEIHGDLPQLPCPHCGDGRTFNGQNCLSRHIKLFHTEKTLLCSLCGEAFKYQYHLGDHILRMHTGDVKMFPCKECDSSFKTHYGLRSHMQFVHEAEYKFQCSECGKQFKNKVNLRDHLVTHTDARPFKCPYDCGLAFKRKITMNDHVKEKHTYETKYGCETCGRRFSSKYEMTIHIRTHTGEKPFKCHLCKAAYIKTSYLKDHLRRTHDINTSIKRENLGTGAAANAT